MLVLLVLLAVPASLVAALGVLPSLSKRAASSPDVTVQLFEWSWESVAAECTDWLGPQGYTYAQVSPAHEHIEGESWWTDYQPVSYKIGDNKRGTAAEFKAMIDTCSKAGVGIIVDAVLNHMTGGSASGTGTAGTTYSQYTYPAVPFTQEDFHTDICEVDWYTEKGTYDCWLSNLQDLKTESTAVRQAQAKYLQAMMDLGVAGFRLDAAKSIPHEDIRAVLDLMSSKPYIVQEVNSDAGQAATPNMYTPNGLVHEFRACYQLRDAFLSGKGLKSLLSWSNSDWVPSESAVVFVANHDTERMDNMLKWSSPNNGYTLASVFVLAQPCGAPAQLSGYNFTSNDAGAPTEGQATCDKDGWRCEQRWTAITAMTKFHNAVSSAEVTNSKATGTNQISFGRGSIGHVAINFEDSSWTATLDTDVADGTYCEIISDCASSITVSVGSFTATIPAYAAIAFNAGGSKGVSGSALGGATISVTFEEEASVGSGEVIFISGSLSQLGAWTAGIPLTPYTSSNSSTKSSSSTPNATTTIWRTTLDLPLPASNSNFNSDKSAVQVKFAKVRKVGGEVVAWESGTNRVLHVDEVSGGRVMVSCKWEGEGGANL